MVAGGHAEFLFVESLCLGLEVVVALRLELASLLESERGRERDDIVGAAVAAEDEHGGRY